MRIREKWKKWKEETYKHLNENVYDWYLWLFLILYLFYFITLLGESNTLLVLCAISILVFAIYTLIILEGLKEDPIIEIIQVSIVLLLVGILLFLLPLIYIIKHGHLLGLILTITSPIIIISLAKTILQENAGKRLAICIIIGIVLAILTTFIVIWMIHYSKQTSIIYKIINIYLIKPWDKIIKWLNSLY